MKYLALFTLMITSLVASEKPNILWIFLEDQSPLFSAYGYKNNPTPTIDKLGKDGVLFTQAFMPTPICSTTRSGLVTGMMPTSNNTHNHRSSRSKDSAIHLPKGHKTIPELFKAAGYSTFNIGKDDYNFVYKREKLYDGKYKANMKQGHKGKSFDWTKTKGKPFFGQLQLQGGKHKGKVKDPIDPQSVELPPYYYDHPLVREQWANHYNTARIADQETKEVLSKLKKAGLLENTVIFFFSDHGYNEGLRHKQFCYDGGLHVPLTITWYGNPAALTGAKVRKDLVNGLDISTTSLALAGIEIPSYMEGKNLFDPNYKRDYVIGTRDRGDYTIDRIRTVRTKRFRYIKNFMTDRALMQPNYRDFKPAVKAQRQAYKDGKMNEVQAALFSPTRIPEEFYDIENDPHETKNLINDPAFAKEIAKHRKILNDWIKRTDDKGQYPESAAALKLMLKWWKSKCVNPEYDKFK